MSQSLILYIDSLQPLVYLVQFWFTPPNNPFLLYIGRVRGWCIKTRRIITALWSEYIPDTQCVQC